MIELLQTELTEIEIKIMFKYLDKDELGLVSLSQLETNLAQINVTKK